MLKVRPEKKEGKRVQPHPFSHQKFYLSIYRLFAAIAIIEDSCKLENGQRSIYK